jgi:hypothetical protein
MQQDFSELFKSTTSIQIMAYIEDIRDIVRDLRCDFHHLVEMKQYIDIVFTLIEHHDECTLNHIELLLVNYQSVEQACLENVEYCLEKLGEFVEESE